MTRNEAIDKISAIITIKLDAADIADMFANAGLIKFDKEEPLLISMIIKNEISELPFINNPMLKADRIVNALYKGGYKIVRKNIGE